MTMEKKMVLKPPTTEIPHSPAHLLTLSIGMIGDYAAFFNRDEEDIYLEERRTSLLFAAHFFYAYFRSDVPKTINPSYLALLGAASYYLCNPWGNAHLLTKHIDGDCPDLEGNGLEVLLLWLLRNHLYTSSRTSCAKTEGRFDEFIQKISTGMIEFFETGNGKKNLLELTKNLRDTVYASGTPRELLLGDIISATVKTHLSVVEKLDPAKAKKMAGK